jgi:hypothetical protein
MSRQLQPDEITRLLRNAVDPLVAAPDAYDRIRAGIDRRQRLRLPAFAVGGLVLAGVIGLAFIALRPPPQVTLVEPAGPPVVTTETVATVPLSPGTASGRGAGGGGGGGGGGPGVPSKTPTRPAQTPSPTGSVTLTPTPSGPSSAPPSGNQGSPTLPPPKSIPATAGDVDGDGVVDPDPTLQDGVLKIELSRLGPVSLPLTTVTTPLRTTVVDIDADGYGEIIVQIGMSGQTRTFGVIKLTSTGMLRMLTGSPMPLSAGLTGQRGDGFRCDAGTLVVVSGDSVTGHLFTVTSTTWDLTDTGQKTVAGPTTSTVDISTSPTPFVADCGTLNTG